MESRAVTISVRQDCYSSCVPACPWGVPVESVCQTVVRLTVDTGHCSDRAIYANIGRNDSTHTAHANDWKWNAVRMVSITDTS